LRQFGPLSCSAFECLDRRSNRRASAKGKQAEQEYRAVYPHLGPRPLFAKSFCVSAVYVRMKKTAGIFDVFSRVEFAGRSCGCEERRPRSGSVRIYELQHPSAFPDRVLSLEGCGSAAEAHRDAYHGPTESVTWFAAISRLSLMDDYNETSELTRLR
jgi:hypothetical protein